MGVVLVWLSLRLSGIARALLLGASGLLLMVPAGVALLGAITTRANKAYQAREARRWTDLQVVLQEPRKANGLLLPAGTTVIWNDQAAGTVWIAQLAGPVQVNGLSLGQDLSCSSGPPAIVPRRRSRRCPGLCRR